MLTTCLHSCGSGWTESIPFILALFVAVPFDSEVNCPWLCRRMLAVILEDSPTISLLALDVQQPALTHLQQLPLALGYDQLLPATVAFAADGTLWAAARSPVASTDGSRAVSLRAWEPAQDGSEEYQVHSCMPRAYSCVVPLQPL